MEHAMAFARLLAVMALSMWLGLALVWLCLLGAFRLLPARYHHIGGQTTKAVSSSRAVLRWAPHRIADKGLPRAFTQGLER